MKRIKFLVLVLSLAAAAVPATAAVDMDAILAAEYAGIAAAMCPSAATGGGGGLMDDYEMHKVEPFQAFDNLYYVGMDNISAWALTTSATSSSVMLTTINGGTARSSSAMPSPNVAVVIRIRSSQAIQA